MRLLFRSLGALLVPLLLIVAVVAFAPVAHAASSPGIPRAMETAMPQPVDNSFALTELEARLVRIVDDADGRTVYETVNSLAEAQGLFYLCPRCFEQNDGPMGTHAVLNWFAGRGVPDSLTPGPGRWEPSGSGLHDVTYTGPAAASVLLTPPSCEWHGFIRRGRAYLS